MKTSMNIVLSILANAELTAVKYNRHTNDGDYIMTVIAMDRRRVAITKEQVNRIARERGNIKRWML